MQSLVKDLGVREMFADKNPNFPVEVFMQENLINHINVENHWHKCVEILFFISGRAYLNINGQPFFVNQNDIVILQGADIHSINCNIDDPTKVLVIKFMPDLINNTTSNFSESKYINAFLNASQSRIYHMDKDEIIENKFQSHMMNIYHEFIKKNNGFELFIKGHIYQLIGAFIREGFFKVQFNEINKKQQKHIAQLLDYIETNYMKPLSLEEASRITNISYYHLSRIFKQATGRNFKQYIDFVRISEAERLLISQDITVTEAAHKVGFSSSSNFNRTFKRVKNYNPSTLK